MPLLYFDMTITKHLTYRQKPHFDLLHHIYKLLHDTSLNFILNCLNVKIKIYDTSILLFTDNCIFAVGGYDGSSHMSSLEKYDPQV